MDRSIVGSGNGSFVRTYAIGRAIRQHTAMIPSISFWRLVKIDMLPPFYKGVSLCPQDRVPMFQDF